MMYVQLCDSFGWDLHVKGKKFVYLALRLLFFKNGLKNERKIGLQFD